MRQAPRQLKSIVVFASALLLALVLAGGAALSAQDQAQKAIWLDRPLVNWNKLGAAIPKSPRMIAPDEISRCHAVIRKPTSREERAVAKAGWMLLDDDSPRTFSGTTTLAGQSGFDGMCRPMGFQVFVFADGRLAGTLSPDPMDSRTDGALDQAPLKHPDSLEASFLRYKDSDPLCCPSAVSSVTFEIERGAFGPLVIPKNVHTQPTSSPN